MPSRRTFLKMNLAVPVALGLGPNSSYVYELLDPEVDFLFVESTEGINIRGVGPGTKVVRFQADPIGLWTEYCLPGIEKGRPVFAGVTSGFTVFSLAEIARDYGYALTESSKLEFDAAPLQINIRNSMSRSAIGRLELNGPDYLQWVLRPTGPNFRQS